ncbi:MAG: hypothetical protein Q8R28_06950 [Dehalococcoidia bacterium]|nr:hypothetical protein [Dehalococcoidia bacterium]
MAYNVTYQHKYTPTLEDSNRTVVMMEFFGPPGLGDTAGILRKTIEVASFGKLTDRWESLLIEQDTEPTEKQAWWTFGQLDRYRVTLKYVGAPEREEEGRVEGGKLVPTSISGVGGGGGIGLAPLGLLPIIAIILVVAGIALLAGVFLYKVSKQGVDKAMWWLAGVLAVGVGGFFLVRALGTGVGNRVAAKAIPDKNPRSRGQ